MLGWYQATIRDSCLSLPYSSSTSSSFPPLAPRALQPIGGGMPVQVISPMGDIPLSAMETDPQQVCVLCLLGVCVCVCSVCVKRERGREGESVKECDCVHALVVCLRACVNVCAAERS